MEWLTRAADLAWPMAIAAAWVLGELASRATRLPRISFYVLVGFLLSHTQVGLLPRPSQSAMLLVADVALGLILFEFGHRINLSWLRVNQWVGASGLLASVTTFFAVQWLARTFGMDPLPGALLAALAMATSPAEVLRVVNEQRGSGQVTERALHLAALNGVLAVFVFNVVLGMWSFQTSGSVSQAVSSSLLVLAVSTALGVAFGFAVPALLRQLGPLGSRATIGLAIAVLLIVALAQALQASPVLAALTFGLTARHRRVALDPAQRNFGALGDLLTVLLFVFVGATLAWSRVAQGLWLALSLVGVRLLTQVGATLLFARLGGISWRKGVLTGVALSPLSALVVVLLVHARARGIDLMDQLAPLAGATLILGLAGPMLTQLALRWAHESHPSSEP